MAQRINNISKSIVAQQTSRLQSIRASSQLNSTELRNLVYLPGNYAKYIKPIYDFIEANKTIFTHHNLEEHDKTQQRKQAAKMILALMKFLKIDLQKDSLQLIYALQAIAAFDLGIAIKGLLHYFLYTKSILLYQNNQKHKEFLKRATNLQDLGCFGLTEFHHGSFNKGMQTLATYEHSTKEFIISTQETKGMKFWIGASAQFANMIIIWAQLIIDGKSQGPHPFIVPIRCYQTHHVLSGIIIGDCGPKNGTNYMDNGYIIMNNVRIPKDNLLGKLGNVNQQGKYITSISNIDIKYGQHMSPLSGGRGLLSFSTNMSVINSATIALRYACGRKQFNHPQKTDQILIIDYPLTKLRIFPHLTGAILQSFAGNYIARAYFEDNSIFQNFKYITELHAISACMKVRVSENCTLGVNECRSVLGEHGYSSLSRISSIYHDTDACNTGEGDNNMLLQQTSKFLMKFIPNKEVKYQIFDISFIHHPVQTDLQKYSQNLRKISNVQKLMQDLLRLKYQNAKSKFQQLSKLHTNIEDVWYYFHPQAGNSLSITYADNYIFSIAIQKIEAAQSHQMKTFLTNALYLWTFHLLEKERYGNVRLRKELQKQIMILCNDLTSPLIIACDILAPSSFIIGSPFANFEGDGFKQYLNILYTSKDTFKRVDYFEDILKLKERK